MNARQILESEIRGLAGDMVSELRVVSEGINPLTRSGMRALVLELEHLLSQLARVSDRLP